VRHGSLVSSKKRTIQAMSVSPLIGDELATRSVRVAPRDVVYVKGIFEASEGLGALFAERGGELTIAVHHSRERELDELLLDLTVEIAAEVEPPAPGCAR
jgi:hypothetical protein